MTEGRPGGRSLPKPTYAVELRPSVPDALAGTGPESGAVPRGRPCQRVIRFRLSRGWSRLPDRVCCAVLVRQTLAHPGDGPAHRWQHDRPPVGVAGHQPACGWNARQYGQQTACLFACLHVCPFACLAVYLPLPVARSVRRAHGELPPFRQDHQTQRRVIRYGSSGLSVGVPDRVRA